MLCQYQYRRGAISGPSWQLSIIYTYTSNQGLYIILQIMIMYSPYSQMCISLQWPLPLATKRPFNIIAPDSDNDLYLSKSACADPEMARVGKWYPDNFTSDNSPSNIIIIADYTRIVDDIITRNREIHVQKYALRRGHLYRFAL